MNIRLKEINLPDFGAPTYQPTIPRTTYERRIRTALERANAADIDILTVYADREHSANMAYLTGFDPRFEESLLILARDAKPVIVVGNECWGHVDVSPVDMRKVLFQDFSLLGQPRGASDPLEKIFADAGVEGASTVGVAGWKYYQDTSGRKIGPMLEIPSYLADTLRSVAGSVVNAGDIFMDAANGLRVINEPEQLAAYEYAGTVCSTAVKNVLFGVKPGMSEYDAVRLMRLNGMPWSCHLMLSAGDKADQGMSSPSDNVIKHGDKFTTAYGVWGSLTSRAGFVVATENELPAGIQDYADKLVIPYFTAVAEWYEEIGIGVEGGDLYEIIHKRIGDPFFGVALNPGHQIGTDEWVNSPIYKGSTIRLESGMALQADVIPATGGDYFMSNIEDGLALADESLRRQLEASYPEAWRRIQARRKFMSKSLGIHLKPEVLPFSNIPAYLPPFVLNPRRVLVKE